MVTHKKTVGLLYLNKMYWYWWKVLIIVFAWVTSNSDFMSLFFFLYDLRLNTNVYIKGEVVWETNKTLYNTEDKMKVKLTAAFTNLIKETIGKSWGKFWSHL